MASYLKDSDVDRILNEVNNLSDIEDKEDFIKGKMKALKDSAEMLDNKSKDVGVTNAELFKQFRDLNIHSAELLEKTYYNTDKPDKNTENDVTRLNGIRENFGTTAIFTSMVIAIAGLITGLIIKYRDTIHTATSAAYAKVVKC